MPFGKFLGEEVVLGKWLRFFATARNATQGVPYSAVSD
jgi:hypothetical protein